ncbi:hypothetical protein [Nocardioides sp.]|uniref:hypothetical protein n=1 Tax=Nocardioides sp. TaxID=35761 RepID=UPI003D0FF2BE
MEMVRIFADADGESRFEDLDPGLGDFAAHGFQTASSDLWPVKAVQFRTVVEDFASDYHTAGQRQLVINLSGTSEIEVSSGERRTIGPGVVLVVEDTTGRGHKAAKTTGEPLHMILVHLGEA